MPPCDAMDFDLAEISEAEAKALIEGSPAEWGSGSRMPRPPLVRPAAGLLEVFVNEVALTLAQLVKMPGQSLFADGLGGPVEGLELIQRRPGAAATVTGTIGSSAR